MNAPFDTETNNSECRRFGATLIEIFRTGPEKYERNYTSIVERLKTLYNARTRYIKANKHVQLPKMTVLDLGKLFKETERRGKRVSYLEFGRELEKCEDMTAWDYPMGGTGTRQDKKMDGLKGEMVQASISVTQIPKFSDSTAQPESSLITAPASKRSRDASSMATSDDDGVCMISNPSKKSRISSPTSSVIIVDGELQKATKEHQMRLNGGEKQEEKTKGRQGAKIDAPPAPKGGRGVPAGLARPKDAPPALNASNRNLKMMFGLPAETSSTSKQSNQTHNSNKSKETTRMKERAEADKAGVKKSQAVEPAAAVDDGRTFTVFSKCTNCVKAGNECVFSKDMVAKANSGSKVSCNVCRATKKRCEGGSHDVLTLNSPLGEYRDQLPLQADIPSTLGDLLVTMVKENRALQAQVNKLIDQMDQLAA